MATTNEPSPTTSDDAPIRELLRLRSVRLFCFALVAAVSISAVVEGCEIGQAGPQSPVDNQAVADLSETSRDRMLSVFEAFEQSMVLDVASMQSVDERCEEGVDDWKRTDFYLERCSLSITRYYGYDGEFDRATHTLHSRLRGAVVLVDGTGTSSVETRTEVVEDVSSASDPSFGPIGRVWGGGREYYRAEETVEDHVPLSELRVSSDHVVAVNLSEIYYVLKR